MGNLTFSRCLGEGKLRFEHLKISNSPGAARTLGQTIDRCIMWTGLLLLYSKSSCCAESCSRDVQYYWCRWWQLFSFNGRLMNQFSSKPDVKSCSWQIIAQAGQVWYPDSAYKTAQAIRDFNKEQLPMIIFANWRGFSGGKKKTEGHRVYQIVL